MRSLMHFLRSSSLNQQTLTVPSAIVNSFPSSVSPQRRPRERKKKTFSAVKDFTSFWWHSGTQKLIGRVKQNKTKKLDQIDEEARLFWGSNVKTKHRRVTNLAFMRLVPGADRAIRNICIRCIIIIIIIITILFFYICYCYIPG